MFVATLTSLNLIFSVLILSFFQPKLDRSIDMFFKVGKEIIDLDFPDELGPEYFQLKKLLEKSIRKQVHIEFLRRCVDSRFVPEGLRLRLPDIGFVDGILNRKKASLEFKILNRLIGFLRKQLAEIDRECRKRWETLALGCVDYVFEIVSENLEDFKKSIRKKEVEKKIVKEKKWGIYRDPEKSVHSELDKRVVNLSRKVLSDEKKEVLSLGCDFGVSRTKNWKRNAIIDIENGLGMLDEELKSGIRYEVKRALDRYETVESNLSSGELKELREISQWDDVIVTKADKGGATVVMDRTQYNEGIRQLLDSGNFEKVGKKFANKSLKVVEDEIELMIKNEIIRKEDRRFWKTTNPEVPQLRGLPKIHKKDVPLRPVVNCKGSGTEKAAKKIAKMLRDTSTLSELSVKNTSHLVGEVKAVPPGENRRIWASLDVVNMFPSIDRKRLWNILEKREREGKIFLREFTTLTKKCVEEATFQWGEDFFIQKNGLPIGSALSPILAEIYMTEWEETFKPEDHPGVLLWRRYVDDVCLCWEGDEEGLHQFVSLANGHWKDIQFQLELQKEEGLPYLDVLIENGREGQVKTSLFKKEVASDILLNRRDALPERTGDNMIKNRVKSVACVTDKLGDDLQVLRKSFVENGHDIRRVDRLFDEALKEVREMDVGGKKDEKSDRQEREKFVVMDYVGRVNYKVERVLKKAGVRVCYRKGRRLENLAQRRLKKDDEFLRSKGVVYEIPCGQCHSSYIGETGQPLKKRLDQHKRSLKNADENNALYIHLKKQNHVPEWDKVKILEFEKDVNRRKGMEAWYIQRNWERMINLNEGVRLDERWGSGWGM